MQIKCFPEFYEAVLVNYQTQGGGYGNPHFIASGSEVWVTQDLQLASEVGTVL